MIFQIALLVISFGACGLFGMIVFGNFTRWPTEPKNLKPNCLLTKTPIVFVTGLRSPFYFRHYWNNLPQFLVAHGYDVRMLRLPWVSTFKRKLWFRRFLVSTPCHLVLDSSSHSEFQELFPELPLHSILVPPKIGELSFYASWIEFMHNGWIGLFNGSKQFLIHTNIHKEDRLSLVLLSRIQLEAEKEWIQAFSEDSTVSDCVSHRTMLQFEHDKDSDIRYPSNP